LKPYEAWRDLEGNLEGISEEGVLGKLEEIASEKPKTSGNPTLG
jgi:hypothetical protein